MSTVIDIATARPVDDPTEPAPELDPLLRDLIDRIPPVSSPRTLAELLDVSTKSLERLREAGKGPEPTKLPGTTMWRYLRPDVVAWLLAGRGFPSKRDRLE